MSSGGGLSRLAARPDNPGMEDHVPIPRDGKLKGWKHPKGVQMVGNREAPDEYPFCRTEVQPEPGANAWPGERRRDRQSRALAGDCGMSEVPRWSGSDSRRPVDRYSTVNPRAYKPAYILGR
jgi:hypothetical protein